MRSFAGVRNHVLVILRHRLAEDLAFDDADQLADLHQYGRNAVTPASKPRRSAGLDAAGDLRDLRELAECHGGQSVVLDQLPPRQPPTDAMIKSAPAMMTGRNRSGNVLDLNGSTSLSLLPKVPASSI